MDITVGRIVQYFEGGSNPFAALCVGIGSSPEYPHLYVFGDPTRQFENGSPKNFHHMGCPHKSVAGAGGYWDWPVVKTAAGPTPLSPDSPG